MSDEEERKISEEEGKILEKNLFELRKKLIEVGDVSQRFGGDVISLSPHSIAIKAKNLDDLYFKAVISDLEHGRLNKITDGSYSGSYRIEFDNANLIIENPLMAPMTPQPRAGIPVSTNMEKVDDYFSKYLISGKLADKEHYTYGAWINGVPTDIELSHNGIPRGGKLNQLEWCVKHFIKKGYGNNHCYITIGCAEGLQRYDLPYKSDAEKGSTECLRGLSLKINDNKLNLTCFFRSWDLIAGMPENLAGFAKLMDYTCNMINAYKEELKPELPEVNPGMLYANSDGLHIYAHDLDIAKMLANID